MKLSDFTNIEDLKKMKQACIDTRAKYDGYRDHQVPRWDHSSCPLCTFDYIWEFDAACKHCPWVVMDRKPFDMISAEPCNKSKFFTQKAMTRRKRLDRWIKLIDEEIRRMG